MMEKYTDAQIICQQTKTKRSKEPTGGCTVKNPSVSVQFELSAVTTAPEHKLFVQTVLT